MAAGRPTTYNAVKVARDIARYLDLCEDKTYLPTVEGLAVHLKVARSTVYLWAKDHLEFSDILEQLLALQASMLIQNGLKGEYVPTMAKMMLTIRRLKRLHVHGAFRADQRVVHGTNLLSPTSLSNGSTIAYNAV